MRAYLACWSARNVLDLYVDGRLAPGRSAHVRRHISACPGCGAAAKELAPLSLGSGSAAVPAGLAESIKRALKQGAAAGPVFVWPALRPAQAAALVYLALLWAAPGFYGAPCQAGSAAESEVRP